MAYIECQVCKKRKTFSPEGFEYAYNTGKTLIGLCSACSTTEDENFCCAKCKQKRSWVSVGIVRIEQGKQAKICDRCAKLGNHIYDNGDSFSPPLGPSKIFKCFFSHFARPVAYIGRMDRGVLLIAYKQMMN